MNTRIYVDLNNSRMAPDGEPIFWVAELDRFVGFDELDYDTSVGEWYVK